MHPLTLWIIQVLAIPALSPLCIGVTRSFKAHLQNRKGASPFQPYRDLRKLFGKNETISADASWIFRVAPFVVFASTLVLAASIPIFSTLIGNSATSDFLVVIYLVALGTFFLALAGMDTGSAFGGFGSSREMLLTSLSEGGLMLSFLVLALVSKTTNLFGIADATSSLPLSYWAPVALAFIAFSIAMLAETCRYPFDNPSTHLELTMVHEAMILEYSGKRLALMEWGAANKYLIFLTLGASLFFPWGLAHTFVMAEIISAFGLFVVKVIVLCTVIAILESTIAKFRIFRLPDLLFTSFAIGIIAIGLII